MRRRAEGRREGAQGLERGLGEPPPHPALSPEAGERGAGWLRSQGVPVLHAQAGLTKDRALDWALRGLSGMGRKLDAKVEPRFLPFFGGNWLALLNQAV